MTQTNWRKIATLGVLYVAQGLPFGVQATALPVLLRQRGVALEHIGLAGLLAAPWMLKALWAPWVDRSGSRRKWIVAMQVCMAAIALTASLLLRQGGAQLALLAWTVLGLNLAAATQDIAVDGLAVDWLGQHELGWGNSAQVAGYKVGMIIGGGLLVWASDSIGWPAVFATMAGIYVAVAMVALGVREGGQRALKTHANMPLRRVLDLLLAQVRKPNFLATLGIISLYKIGETVMTTMFKPFLVDAGFSAGQIGQWVGTWGMVASMAGSLGGGWMVQKVGGDRALRWAAAARCVAMLGELAVAAWHPTPTRVIAATCIEHAFGGALTTTLFAWMMARVDARVGASHYTLLASCEVLGKLPSSWLSGFLAARAGYFGAFLFATGFSVAYAAALPALQRRAAHALPPAGQAIATP